MFILKKWLLSFLLLLLVSIHVSAQEGSDPLKAQGDLKRGLLLTPRAFRAAVAKVQPSLVTIESFGGSSTVAGKIGGIRKQGEGNTTGLMISPDGYVVTSSFNFIEQPTTITVITSDGVRRVAELMGRDDTRRICLLKIDDVRDMPVAEAVAPDGLRVGQWAISVGVGYGDKNPAISTGIISAKQRMGGRAIQTDANISPANYGGPLLDIEGRVIGICVPMSADSRSLAGGVEWYDSGIGFCIPISGGEDLIEKMKQGQHIQRGVLGVKTQDIKNREGVRVLNVLPQMPAANAGIAKGDILVGLESIAIANLVDLKTALERQYAGDEIEVVIERAGKQQRLKVTLAAPVTEDSEDVSSVLPSRRRAQPKK